jgi:hypothetical protein
VAGNLNAWDKWNFPPAIGMKLGNRGARNRQDGCHAANARLDEIVDLAKTSVARYILRIDARKLLGPEWRKAMEGSAKGTC